ncbi:MAG TPA: protein kinase [Pirellulales bacterium]|jgi:serine/threonine protein kinase|nr:protein kinase [Pirellulales bacterium]
MSATDAELEQLDELAAEISARFRRGEHPSVAEYAGKYPQLASELKALFPTIAAMERLKVKKEFRSGSRASLRGLQLTRLGDFRIIREIGRGGMGIVYEAEQESLARRVAVKVLPRHVLLAPEHLQRFQREAQIAGRLHQTNIVSVFGVGEHEGFHYYVMPFIQGVGLDRVIHRLAETNTPVSLEGDTKTAKSTAVDDGGPLAQLDEVVRQLFSDSRPQVGAAAHRSTLAHPERAAAGAVAACSAGSIGAEVPGAAAASRWARIARIGWQVANALDFAHQHGTLHCDIKPANLLVDAQGTVWVTDFGVAKAMQADKLTRTGDVTGTLHYTAPERFQGQTDARSDVYSLGLTLYELLALRPAFYDADRESLLRRILEGHPTALRKLVPDIPRDLETIVLTAIAREPRQRYQTARDLAEDLERFREDRPILARRSSTYERLARWGRKNPAIASLLGAVTALVVAVVFLITRGLIDSRQLQEAESKQRHKAEQTTQVALDVLDRIYAQFAPRDSGSAELALTGSEGTEVAIPVRPALSPETAVVLENLLAFYDRLAIDGADNRELRREAAKANRRVADIQAHLGQRDKAQAAYRKALLLYEELAAESNDDNFSSELANIHNELARLNQSSAKQDAAQTDLHEALQILEPLAAQASALPETRYELARTYYSLATAIRGSNIPMGRDLIELSHEPPNRRDNGPPGFRGPAGRGPDGFAPNGAGLEGPGHDGPEHDGPGHDGPGHDGPGHDGPGHDGPNGRGPYGRPLDGPGSKSAFQGPNGSSAPRGNAPENPPGEHPDPSREPAPGDFGDGSGPGRPPQRPGFGALDRFEQRDPGPPRDRGFDPHGPPPDESEGFHPPGPGPDHPRGNGGPAGNPREEDAYLQKAIALLKVLCVEVPTEPDYRQLLARCYRELARSPIATPSDANGGFDQALQILQKLVKDFPQQPEYRFDLIVTQSRLAAREPRDLAAKRELEQQLRGALESAAQLVSENPDIPAYAAFQVPLLHKLAALTRGMGRAEDSLAALRQAEKIQLDLVARYPDVPSYQLWLVIVQRSLAEILRSQGQLADARQLLEAAVQTLSGMPQTAATPRPARELLSDSYYRLSLILNQLGDKQASAELLRKAQRAGPPQ